MTASLAVAGAMELVVDQGANTLLGLTARTGEFPHCQCPSGVRPRRVRHHARAAAERRRSSPASCTAPRSELVNVARRPAPPQR